MPGLYQPITRKAGVQIPQKATIIPAGVKERSGAIKKPQRSGLVIPARFERATYCLEGSCSIQLSYGILIFRAQS